MKINFTLFWGVKLKPNIHVFHLVRKNISKNTSDNEIYLVFTLHLKKVNIIYMPDFNRARTAVISKTRCRHKTLIF